MKARRHGMNEGTLKQIITDAIAGLPDKTYIKELVESTENLRKNSGRN